MRFTWQEQWGHEAEAITPLDAAAKACDTLGFPYVALRGESREDTLAAILTSIDDGVPALTSGLSMAGTHSIYRGGTTDLRCALGRQSYA